MALKAGSVYVDVDANTSKFKKGMKGVGSDLEGIKSSIKKFGLALGAAGAAAGVFAIKSAASYEQSRIAFDTLLGSAEKGKRMLKEVSDFARATPFDLPQVTAAAKQLLAMGASANEVIPELKMLGDVSAGLSVPMERIILNFGQVRTQGKLTGRELKDFSVAGVPLIAQLSEQLKVSEDAIHEMVSKGEIKFPIVKKAFEDMTSAGGKFEDLMGKQAKTMGGIWENLSDELGRFARDLVGMTDEGEIRENSLFAIAKDVAKGFLDFLQRNSGVIKAYISGISRGLIFLGSILASIAVLNFFQKIITGIGSALKAIKMFVVSTSVMKLAALSVFGVIGAIVGYAAVKAFDRMQKKVFDTSNDFVDDTDEMAEAAKENISGGSGSAGKATEDLTEKMQEFDDEMDEITNNYKTRAKEIVVAAQEKKAELEKELQEEEEDFKQSMAERTKTFEERQADMTLTHDRKVEDIKEQIAEEKEDYQLAEEEKIENYKSRIAEELAKGEEASQEKIAELESELAKSQEKLQKDHTRRIADLEKRLSRELDDHEKQFAELQEDYKEDTEAAKKEHEKKKNDLQVRLDKETEFLNKHADVVEEIRDHQLMDEIESLIDQTRKRKEELDRQREDAINSAKDATSGMAGELNKLPDLIQSEDINNSLKSVGETIGTDMATSFKEAFLDELAGIGEVVKEEVGGEESWVYKGLKWLGDKITAPFWKFDEMATGGMVNMNQPYIVGERGAEMFVPQQNGTIIPNHKLDKLGGNYTVNVNVTGGNFDTDSDANEFGKNLGRQIQLAIQGVK